MTTATVEDPAAARVRPGWTSQLLETEGSALALARRAAIGGGLAAIYGLALGSREGGLSILTHAVGVPAALFAVALLGVPALYIVLALFDAPLSPRKAVAAAVRGCASAGLVLAGLAPLAAIYVLGSESAEGAGVAAAIGLALGGLLGLRHLSATLKEALARADSATRFMAVLAQIAFALFAIMLAWRVWSALLPMIGGGA
jgi:hypothetical protein